jgi:hypothetical protein
LQPVRSKDLPVNGKGAHDIAMQPLTLNTMDLLKDEIEITRSGDNSIIVTSSRVIQNIGKDVMTISIDKVSCTKVHYSNNIILLIIGSLLLLAGLVIVVTGQNDGDRMIGGATAALGAVFLVMYMATRKHVVSIISDSGHSINFMTKGIKNDEVLAFIGKIEQARIDLRKTLTNY